MGFLDSLVRSATRKIMNEVVDNVVDDVIGNLKGNNNGVQPVNTTVSQTTSNHGTVETTQFQPVSMMGNVTAEYFFCTGDESGRDVDVTCQFQLPREFIDYGNTHAGEIDCLYVYSPEDVEEGYVEDFAGKPHIYFGYEKFSAGVVNYYLKNGTVKAGEKLTKIEGSFVKFKTEIEYNDEYLIAYHYYRRFESDILYQIVLSLPKKYKGTDLGNEMEQVLDCVVSTYSDSVKYA